MHSDYSSGNPSQAAIYSYIQQYNGESGWATSPKGLTYGIYNWTPPAHHYAHWCYAYPTTVAHGMAWTMDKWKNPVEALIYNGAHWIVIVGFSASTSPYQNRTTARIYGFWVNDPWYPRSPSFVPDQFLWADMLCERYITPVYVSGTWYNYRVTVERDDLQGVIRHNLNDYGYY